MIRLTSLRLPLDHSDDALPAVAAKRLGLRPQDLIECRIFKRAYDARRRSAIYLIYTLDVVVDVERASALLEEFADDPNVRPTPDTTYQLPAPELVTSPSVRLRPRPVVIGMGPCGLFAALILAEMGLRPLVFERGKKVRERTVDTFSFWRKGRLDPESNVQFGEGGAGTFSDGKLYSQIRDPRHYGRKVLAEFVQSGAPKEILFESRPHIGTFKLVKMVESLRAKIESLGGEIRFGCRVDELCISNGQLRALRLADGEEVVTNEVVLAVGHSARDTFEMLHRCGVSMEAKAFSIGFRAEHPQRSIDSCRYGKFAGHPMLGAADYRLSHHCQSAGLEGRTVYSFCMCPGGTVVAASSEPGRVVTNGMSQYDRSERNANSGIVVDINPSQDFPGGPLAGIELQRKYESLAFELGGKDYRAPAQLLGDFLKDRPSEHLGSVAPSYTPGVRLGDISSCLPAFAIEAIREAIPVFERKLPGFAAEDALFTAVETRTSSPVRVGRGDDGQSLNVQGLFPAGEGAGYAGGILSAGVDGIRAAEAVAQVIAKT